MGPGEKLGDLDIGELIGRGGMARVYRAWDRRLCRAVAVKVPSSEVAADLLIREAQALAAFHHNGLPTIYQIGDTACDVPYIVMELLRGRTLATHLEQADGGLPWPECVDLLLRVSDVLSVLHRSDLAHRDLKPENIMLCAGGRIVLLDLGITSHEREVSDSSTMSGSPEYVAPEAITSSIEIGHGNLLDIYALGVMAFEMLTGHVPYEGDTIMRLLNEHLVATVPRVSALHPDVPVELDALVSAMMAKDWQDRPQEIGIVSASLRRALGSVDAVQRGQVSVIVADDDPIFRELVGETLLALFDDVSVRHAANGDEALRRYRSARADLLILDLDMPKLNGVEVCMHLQGTSAMKETTVAVLSAHATGAERAFLSELGVAAFIDKKRLSAEALADVLSEQIALIRRRRLALAPIRLKTNH